MKSRTLILTLAVAIASAVIAPSTARADGQTALALGPNLNPLTVADVQPKPIGSVATCRNPNRAAEINGPVYADYPTVPHEQGVVGTTDLRVDIAPNGSLKDATVMNSSGNKWLDYEAMRTTKLSAFSPEVRDCHTIAGAYMLTVTFSNA